MQAKFTGSVLASPTDTIVAPLQKSVPKEVSRLLYNIQQRGVSLMLVPEHLCKPELTLAALQQDGMTLQAVPEALSTEALCLAAVQQNGLALQFVPTHQRTASVCLAAAQQNPEALGFIKDMGLFVKTALALDIPIDTSEPVSGPALVVEIQAQKANAASEEETNSAADSGISNAPG